MFSQSLIHDSAWSASVSVLQVIAHLLREEEQRTALEEIYDRIKAALVEYETKSERLVRRVKPGNN